MDYTEPPGARYLLASDDACQRAKLHAPDSMQAATWRAAEHWNYESHMCLVNTGHAPPFATIQAVVLDALARTLDRRYSPTY